MRLIYPLTLLLLTATTLPLFAQSDTIKPSPAAVEMRRVWMLKGEPYQGAGIGQSASSVGDIDGDGIAEIAIRAYPLRWSLYKGGNGAPDTAAFWTFDREFSARPLVGDFWGTGRRAIGFARRTGRFGTMRILHIFRTESYRLSDSADIIWPVTDRPGTDASLAGVEYHAHDLDLDGDDELIISMTGRRIDTADFHAQIWIYDGGPDFQLDTPTVVIREEKINRYAFRLVVTHLDDDRLPDLLTVGSYDEGSRTRYYFGQPNALPASSQRPDRDLPLGEATYLDADGDGITDFFYGGGVAVYRSNTGKSARTRSYDSADIDDYLISGSGPMRTSNLGYLNSKRFEVLGGVVDFGLIAFSGSEQGPDHLWDGYARDSGAFSGTPFQYIEPISDCTGDGWDDLLAFSSTYNYDGGIALVLAGGPYIPSEDPTVSVRTLPLQGKPNALSLWPNPVREHLNIAWRGDLARMPRRFEIHDITGRKITSGSVPDGDGAAVWNSAGQPAGSYLLSVFDSSGALLATTTFIRN